VHRPPVDFRLYLITDRKLFADRTAFLDGIRNALEGGVRAVQLREKDLPVRGLLELAYELREITAAYDARFFINDRVDIALAVKADGVHLGRSSIPVRAARKAAGEDILIGVSTHSVEEAEEAEKEGADLVTLGPVYETPSKIQYGRPLGPEVLKTAWQKISVPVFAIGGISRERVAEVLNSGAHGIALIRGILAGENAKKKAEDFLRLLSKQISISVIPACRE
jgi:thiamine-phosphate pyrophosphorylase